MRAVFDQKLNIVRCARESWPKYASLDEDLMLRKEKWEGRYNNQRVIQWDNTNVAMTKPGDAAMQRTTYSQYYKENCAKGGVFLQFCGWMGTASLWTGGVGDSEYQTNGTIISDQKDFAQNDIRANGEFNPFIMLLDKGYCIMDILLTEKVMDR